MDGFLFKNYWARKLKGMNLKFGNKKFWIMTRFRAFAAIRDLILNLSFPTQHLKSFRQRLATFPRKVVMIKRIT